MKYVFQALAIDDEPQMIDYFNVIKQFLLDIYQIQINFDVIHEEKDYQREKSYDILLIDYDLKRGYSVKKQQGNEVIKEFRKYNRISKVIFYSSSFVYSDEKKNYVIALPVKEIYDLINDYQINKIASKENFDMMVKVIKECCAELDILPLILVRMLSHYKKAGIETIYTNSKGDEIDANGLIDEIMNDNEEGKKFREKFTEAVLNTMFDFKY